MIRQKHKKDYKQAQNVWQSLRAKGLTENRPFEDVSGRIKAFYPKPTGGLLFLADKLDSNLWWIFYYAPGWGLKPKEIYRVLYAVSNKKDCEKLAFESEDKRIISIMKRFGFVPVEDENNVYVIEC